MGREMWQREKEEKKGNFLGKEYHFFGFLQTWPSDAVRFSDFR